MKTVAILASDYCLYSGVASPMDMFMQAGITWNSFTGQQPSPFFDVKVVTLEGQPVVAYNDAVITPHCSIDEIEHADLIIIPSQGFHYDNHDEAFLKRVEWLKASYEKGSDLASVCTGAFTLAATGLLDGKMATTHWGAAQAFSRAYPAVELRTDMMVTDEGRLFCGGGMTADLNLSLYLIDKYCGREIALQSSRCTLVDLDRLSQLPFAVFVPEKEHTDTEILAIQNWIEKNYQINLSLQDLAEKAGISPRHFNRRFKAATKKTLVQYIQHIRVEAAKCALEQSQHSFDSISFDVGYDNVSFFRRLFKRITGLSPSNYRKKFGITQS